MLLNTFDRLAAVPRREQIFFPGQRVAFLSAEELI